MSNPTDVSPFLDNKDKLNSVNWDFYQKIIMNQQLTSDLISTADYFAK